jgi:hypothetical protein
MQKLKAGKFHLSPSLKGDRYRDHGLKRNYILLSNGSTKPFSIRRTR